MANSSEGVIQIPMDFATNLKCIVCSGYLSVPPIVSGNNGKNVCGRCDFITYNKQERRNVIYENVAKLMSFPCIFEKCSKKVSWGEVEKHEKICPHNTIVCPKKGCQEIVLVQEITTHFTWRHKLEKSNTFNMKMLNINDPDLDSPQLLICKEKPYLCFCYKSDTFLGISVYSLDPVEDDTVKYFVALTSNNGILIKGRQKVLPFNSRVHCADCFESKCTKKHHKYSLNYKNNSTQELHNAMTTKFELDSVKKILEAEKVTFKVTLTDTSTTFSIGKKRKISSVGGSESECDTCKILMALPADSHKSGISLIHCIKEKIKQCPCNSNIKDILEDFDVVDLMDDIKDEDDVQNGAGKDVTENGGNDDVELVEAEDPVKEV